METMEIIQTTKINTILINATQKIINNKISSHIIQTIIKNHYLPILKNWYLKVKSNPTHHNIRYNRQNLSIFIINISTTIPSTISVKHNLSKAYGCNSSQNHYKTYKNNFHKNSISKISYHLSNKTFQTYKNLYNKWSFTYKKTLNQWEKYYKTNLRSINNSPKQVKSHGSIVMKSIL